MVLLAGSSFGLPAISQPGERGAPDRERLRERLTEELERTREKERWLLAKLDSVDDDTGHVESLLGRDWGEPRGRPGADLQPMGEADTKRMVSLLRDIHANYPDLEANSPFRRVLDKDTEDRRRLLQRMAPKLRELLKLRDTNTEKYELRRDEMIAGFAIAKAARRLGVVMHQEEPDQSDIDYAKQALRDSISLGFDAKAAVARYELGEVQAKLEKLSTEIETAESERTERIEDYYEAMLRKIEDHSPRDIKDGEGEQRERRKPSRDD
ncbi:MAG: hypothetical protein ED559_07165 [Phycisphaera sp.]|nr:MAG: hypothetical protein ED559_07165 [Phycisphaera sp.]